MLIFPVSFRFNGCSPKGIRRKHRRIEKRNSTAKVHKSKSDKRTSTNIYAKRHQDCIHEPKIGPKEAENDPRSAPKWCQEGPKRHQKAISNRKSNEKPYQDEHQTDLDPPRGRFAPFSPTPRGPFGSPKRSQNGAENDFKSKRKSKRKKKRSKTILDPSWGDLGSILAPSWGPFW